MQQSMMGDLFRLFPAFLSILQLIEKLSVRKPTGEVKLKVLKEIAKEYQVQWDSTESEQEFLKPPEEVIVCC